LLLLLLLLLCGSIFFPTKISFELPPICVPFRPNRRRLPNQHKMTRLTRNGKCVNDRSFVVAQLSFAELFIGTAAADGRACISCRLSAPHSVSNDL
jgi:hypothetical protein